MSKKQEKEDDAMRRMAMKAIVIQRTVASACNGLDRADTISAIGHAVAQYAAEFKIDVEEIAREMRAATTVIKMMQSK